MGDKTLKTKGGLKLSHGANRGSNPRGDASKQYIHLAQVQPQERLHAVPRGIFDCPDPSPEIPQFHRPTSEKLVNGVRIRRGAKWRA